eukprot:6474137-Amphidinium_carterae.1
MKSEVIVLNAERLRAMTQDKRRPGAPMSTQHRYLWGDPCVSSYLKVRCQSILSNQITCSCWLHVAC